MFYQKNEGPETHIIVDEDVNLDDDDDIMDDVSEVIEVIHPNNSMLQRQNAKRGI
jgi:hypothetical protein